MQLEQDWGNKLPGVTRSQLTRVLRELLPRRRHTPADLRQWLLDTQLRLHRNRLSSTQIQT